MTIALVVVSCDVRVVGGWCGLWFAGWEHGTVGCVYERSLGGGTVADRGEGRGLSR